MRIWAPLNDRQLHVLRQVGADDGAAIADWADVATSVQALRNRRLVEVGRSPEGRRVSLTDAGRYYLEHGEHPDKPAYQGDRPSQAPATRGAQKRRSEPADDRAVDDLLRSLSDGAGEFRVNDPDPATRAMWRRAIHAAKEANRVPDGFHLRHRGRDSGDLVVELVEGEHPDKTYRTAKAHPTVMVDVLESGLGLHPVAEAVVAAADLSDEVRPRAARLVHAVVVTAEQQGHKARFDESASGRLVIAARGTDFHLVVLEEEDEVDRIEPPEEAKVYSWQRIRPQRVMAKSGRLAMGFADYDYRFQGRRQRWADRTRWKLDDKLGELLAEIESRSVDLEERRKAEEETKAKRHRAWEAAIHEARRLFVEDRRRQRLLKQIDGWQESVRVKEYCGYLQELVDAEQDAGRRERLDAWLAWARAYGAGRDPSGWPDLVAEDPVPTERDLEPFLDGWSPYGPDRSARRWRSD